MSPDEIDMYIYLGLGGVFALVFYLNWDLNRLRKKKQKEKREYYKTLSPEERRHQEMLDEQRELRAEIQRLKNR
ncbi:hypothetical protein ACMXYX_18135 (plasmid) [Neptuniibacter sp. QD72_48]|uniref:hypothetical protein n=1 Tax=Neptuniibacter sp. QD72_48 TaxID=3398214 RepID=UPI0039F4B849